MNDQLIKNLETLNEWPSSREKKVTLHLIGSYAFYLKGIENRYTEDIDNINEISDDEIVDKIHEIGAYYTRKEQTIRDLTDIMALAPTENELDYGLKSGLKKIRQEINRALGR